MASYVPPKRATAYRMFVTLRSQANSTTFQTNPTLAAGDVKVSIDGGAFANLTTLPVVTPAGGKGVQVDLSLTEMTGDNVLVVFSDVAGAEWFDLAILLQTTTLQINDLATPTNITAGTITTVTNLTNAPAAGDLTPTMKASVTTAATAATPTAAAVTGNVGGNVVGSVGSVTAGVTLTAAYDAAKTASSASAVSGVPAAVLSAASAAPIAADAKKMNGTTINGTGTAGDLWRGA